MFGWNLYICTHRDQQRFRYRSFPFSNRVNERSSSTCTDSCSAGSGADERRTHHFRRLRRVPQAGRDRCWWLPPQHPGQRIRWQRGLGESLWHDRGLLFHPRGGEASWLMFPVHGAVRTTGSGGGTEWLRLQDRRIRVLVHQRGGILILYAARDLARRPAFDQRVVARGNLLLDLPAAGRSVRAHLHGDRRELRISPACAGVAAGGLRSMGDLRTREVGRDEAEFERAGHAAVAAVRLPTSLRQGGGSRG